MTGWVAVALAVSACTAASTDTSLSSDTSQPSGSADPTTAGTTEPSSPSGLVCWASETAGEPGPITLVDSTEKLGLIDPLIGMHGHASAFGDVDGDTRPDLFVGTFGNRNPENYQERGATGPRPDQLLIAEAGFQASDLLVEELGRTSGSAFADLDGDGDDDLIIVRHAGLRADSEEPSRIYVNGARGFDNIEILPPGFLGRTPAIADFDVDGLLDIYVSEDKYGDRGGLLYRNDGAMAFTDVTEASGLAGAFALGATAADVNDDGYPDIVTSRNVFIGHGDLTFTDATPEGYVLASDDVEDDPAGVAVGDVNRDGIADIVIGQHFRSTIGPSGTAPVRLLLGTGTNGDGVPGYVDSTNEWGLPDLPTLAPQVALADLDNDGWPDIVTSASAADGSSPAIMRHLGSSFGFEPPAGLGSDQYWVGASITDLDQDGRLDVFAVEWEPSLPSLMFLNEGTTGNWLEVSVQGAGRGVGTQVTVLDAEGNLIGRQEIGVGGGYSSGQMAVAHFGLGEATDVTVELRMPGGAVENLGTVPINAHLRWPSGCS